MKEKHSLKDLLSIFLCFFKLGIFSIGGGPVMLTLLKGELVEKKHWINDEELVEMMAISESTPGPIAINLATYLGYKKGGILGALLATLGVIITPFALMFVISLFLQRILEVETIKYAFMGVKVGVVFLLLKVSYDLIKNIKKDIFGIIAITIVTIAMIVITILSVNFSAIYFILLGAVLGILIYAIIPKRKGDKK